MKVKLFLQETVEDFADNHSTGKKIFVGWLNVIKNADWNEPLDMTNSVKGNLLGNGSNRVVFDIGGNGSNSFRIICEYLFGQYYKKSETYKVHLYVNWIGTHEEYNRLTPAEKLTINRY